MAVPILTEADLLALPEIEEVLGPPSKGGQKLVFPCLVDGEKVAVKFLLTSGGRLPDDEGEDDEDDEGIGGDAQDEVAARAKREVGIMEQCESPFLVKAGSIPLTVVEIRGEKIVYFAEEWIDGEDVARGLRNGPYVLEDSLRLGVQITEAIKELWSFSKVHRDLKPANIMRRANGDFVLLDMGLALDLEDISLSGPGMIPGTLMYLSPERVDFAKRRFLDFRSDMYSLGMVLYEAATGQHPFYKRGMDSTNLLAAILQTNPAPPSSISSHLPPEFDEVVQRMLSRSPHLRFRTCDRLIQALKKVPVKQEGGK